MTRESRTVAIWFCGLGSDTIVREMSAYCWAPSLLKEMAISTVPVTTPWELLW